MVLEGDFAGLTAIGAGLAVGLAGIGTGLGQGDAAAAAIGAITEGVKTGQAIIWVVLPETIVIFGLVIAFMLIMM